VREGDPHVDFESFVSARQGALLRTAYLITGNHQDAEDLVQTALIKAVAGWGRVREHEAYVRRILVNESVTRWRRRRWRETAAADVDDRPGPEVDLDQNLVLRQALGRLAPRQRAVIVLRYFDDLTEAQTAEALGISVGTVKSQSRDALARLRVLVPGIEPPDSMRADSMRADSMRADVIRSEPSQTPTV
jgi:RNA polymerase sigma-70 factor (sigma-E family)